MNRHAHRPTQYASFSAAVVFASLAVAGAAIASPPFHQTRPVRVAPVTGARSMVSKSTTMTPQEADRFRARMNSVPHLNRLSGRAQVRAFVGYFAARGFRSTAYAAKYSPSGRIETLEYHASRSGRATNKVDVSIGRHHSATAISMN